MKKRATKFCIWLDQSSQTVKIQWGTKTPVHTLQLVDGLLLFITRHYNIVATGEVLNCLTEYMVVEESTGLAKSVRCHPNFQSGGKWNDWGFVRRHIRNSNGNIVSTQVLPAKFWCWIERPDSHVEAIVQICSRRIENQESVLTRPWSFPLINGLVGMNSIFHCIDRKDYVKEAFILEGQTGRQVLEIISYNEWCQEF